MEALLWKPGTNWGPREPLSVVLHGAQLGCSPQGWTAGGAEGEGGRHFLWPWSLMCRSFSCSKNVAPSGTWACSPHRKGRGREPKQNAADVSGGTLWTSWLLGKSWKRFGWEETGRRSSCRELAACAGGKCGRLGCPFLRLKYTQAGEPSNIWAAFMPNHGPFLCDRGSLNYSSFLQIVRIKCVTDFLSSLSHSLLLSIGIINDSYFFHNRKHI